MKSKILLNVCCAPCALPLVEAYASKEEFLLYFFNPNIFPEEEYQKRLEEAKRVSKIYNLPLWEGNYEHQAWLDYLKKHLSQPLESYPENGSRCLICFQFRLEATFQAAKEKEIPQVATTLSLSRFKDVNFINRCGENLAKELGLIYRTFELDPWGAYRQGLELSKKHNIYRQKYCGCEFSMPV